MRSIALASERTLHEFGLSTAPSPQPSKREPLLAQLRATARDISPGSATACRAVSAAIRKIGVMEEAGQWPTLLCDRCARQPTSPRIPPAGVAHRAVLIGSIVSGSAGIIC